MRWNILAPALSLCTFVLTLLASLSAPIIRTIDLFSICVTAPSNADGLYLNGPRTLVWKFGMTGLCTVFPVNSTSTNTVTTCSPLGLGYHLEAVSLIQIGQAEPVRSTILPHSLSRALVLNPLSSAVAAVAFILSMSQLILKVGKRRCLSMSVMIISFVSATLTTVAFIVDTFVAGRVAHILPSVVTLPASASGSAEWGNAIWIVSGAMIVGWFGLLAVVFEHIKQSKVNSAKLAVTY